ncbi:hypothetical protein OH77DRAFT_1474907 [Trametes cingulata]|nr:hypothetical protein OH77DRAFT_1474907 [Trametes cingulata]
MASNNEAQNIRAAGHPFDNPAADTVLQSSDGVQFRVHSVIVSEASEVFADMFTVPLPPPSSSHPADVSADGRPVVRLDEDSQTLDDLLCLCYPVADPELTDPARIRRVLAASMKYDMEEATEILEKALRSLIVARPLEVWAVACSLHLDNVALEAASELLEGGGNALPACAPALLEDVTAGQYFRLLKYLTRHGAVDDTFSFWKADRSDAVVDAQRQRRVPTYNTLTLQERPFADVVCRSSDGQDLLSHKVVLATVSPVLRERLLALDAAAQATRPQPPTDASDGAQTALPVLQFDEPGNVLSAILELSYPIRRWCYSDLALSLDDICAFTSAAQKYEMEFVLRSLESAFARESFDDPLRGVLLASRAGLPEYAKLAAARVLRRRDRQLVQHGWYPEIETMPALAYHQLSQKHHALRDSADARRLNANDFRKRRRTEDVDVEV